MNLTQQIKDWMFRHFEEKAHQNGWESAHKFYQEKRKPYKYNCPKHGLIEVNYRLHSTTERPRCPKCWDDYLEKNGIELMTIIEETE
jgi:hypothetical protein